MCYATGTVSKSHIFIFIRFRITYSKKEGGGNLIGKTEVCYATRQSVIKKYKTPEEFKNMVFQKSDFEYCFIEEKRE